MKDMTEPEVIAAIRADHLQADISEHEGTDDVIHWDRAWVDTGGMAWGPGPYLKVPITLSDRHDGMGGEEIVRRVHAPERLRKKLAERWKR